MQSANQVTPFVGVWIETRQQSARKHLGLVTPFVGVWIETLGLYNGILYTVVTPFVGVWIETISRKCNEKECEKSHPSWVCGLKQRI